MPSRNWTREELIVAFNLYCKIPFGRIHIRNPQIISLAKLLGRTPSAVSWKLANFSRLDPTLKKRGIKGASHGAKSDEEIWQEFSGNWEQLAFESERLLAQMSGRKLDEVASLPEEDLPREGKERARVVRTRINQQFFRAAVLAAYHQRCCITGLAVPELLNASHIVPWSVDTENRVNPRNGLCLNAIHDRAFDRGLLTIRPSFTVKLSPLLRAFKRQEAIKELFLPYEGKRIELPSHFTPEIEFLRYHNETVFKQ